VEGDVGTPFGRYRLIELLGRGGMGEVWRAHDTAIDRMVAIKMLLPQFAEDTTFKQRFRREARAAARLDDPHVVPIYDVGEIDSRLFVTMRLVAGADLQTIINRAPLDPHRTVRIIEHVASALDTAHQVGLVHRDVKPSNVLIAQEDFSYLIDFGIARAAGEGGLTTTGATIGSWSYMAPERFRTGEIEPSSDIYALTCVLYQSLTGRLPFPGSTLENIAIGHMMTPPPKPSAHRHGIPVTLDDVVATGLAKVPDQRYPTAKELAQAARAALNAPVRHSISRTSRIATRSAEVWALPTLAARPSSQYGQALPPVTGMWAKVVAAGDDHYGQIGQITGIWDGQGEDGLDVTVRFRGDPSSYPFRRDELVPAASPGKRQPAPSASPGIDDFGFGAAIDPIRMITPVGDFVTLRSYRDDSPIFLGTKGMINVFHSGQTLRRYLSNEPCNDMSSLSTYGGVTTAVIQGSLPVDEVRQDNTYTLKGLAEDIAAGPDRVDRGQLELAVELLSDVGKYAGNTIVHDYMRRGQALGDLVKTVQGYKYILNSKLSPADAASQWRRLENFLESRLIVEAA